MSRAVSPEIAVTGSVAFDHIMNFGGQFKDHILPDKLHVLNVSFLVQDLKRLKGGCAANIGYACALHGLKPSLLAAADSIHVTADSVAMVSDAIWAGKPIAIIPVTTSALGRLAIASFGGAGRRLYPQDLRAFWAALADIGISDRPSLPQTSGEQELRTIMNRVRPILER